MGSTGMNHDALKRACSEEVAVKEHQSWMRGDLRKMTEESRRSRKDERETLCVCVVQKRLKRSIFDNFAIRNQNFSQADCPEISEGFFLGACVFLFFLFSP